jgi:hypothetical protein
MKNPASPVARRAGLRIDKPSSNVRSYSPPAHAPQLPIGRRPPNRPFRDDVPASSGLESLSVGIAGGADRRLLDLLGGGDR